MKPGDTAPTGGTALNNLTSGLNGGSGAAVTSTDGAAAAQTVFLGYGNYAHNPNPNPSDHPPVLANLADALIDYRNWSPERLKDWAERAYIYGYTTSPFDYQGALKTWQSMVKQAAIFHSGAGNPNISPDNVLEMFQGGNAKELSKRRAAGPRSITSTQNSINLTDPATARAAVNVTLRRMLGRDATDAEVHALTDAIHAKEKANPNSTTTTTQYDASGQAKSSSSVSSGGFGQDAVNALLESSAQKNPEYGEYQAAAFYLPQLLGMLGVNHGPSAGGPTGRG